MVTQTETVHPAVQGYLDDVGATATLLGGTAALLSSCGDPQVEMLVLGWEGLIPESVATSVDQLDGGACP